MPVTVKYFASLRESLGRNEEQLDIGGEQISVADLWCRVARDEKTLPDHVLTAINMEYVKPDAVVKDGDEVAFFPPVTGG